MTPPVVALTVVIALWASPFILVALYVLAMLRDDRRHKRLCVEREQRAGTAPGTHAPRLRLVDQRATVVDLDSRRRARSPEGAA